MLKSTTKLLTKETCGRFKLSGDEPSKTGRNEIRYVLIETLILLVTIEMMVPLI